MILRYALGHFPIKKIGDQSSQQQKQEIKFQKTIVPSIDQIKKSWNQYSQGNQDSDMATQTFYFSFLTMMKIPMASNILEIGCGAGRLIPMAFMLKKSQATYLATDLAQNMIEKAKNNLKQNFSKYESQLKFQQWCQKNHLSFKIANGEDILHAGLKFDRIICNCVLMITENPQKMLKSLFDQAQKGCLLGISVWGDKQKNPILKFICQTLQKESDEDHLFRQEFHLYKKVTVLAQKIGWKLLLQWEQNALVPIMSLDKEGGDFNKTVGFFTNYLPQNKRPQVGQKIIKKASELIDSKQGLNFSAELYIFQKPF